MNLVLGVAVGVFAGDVLIRDVGLAASAFAVSLFAAREGPTGERALDLE